MSNTIPSSGNAGGGTSSFNPFLKPAHIGKTGTTGVLKFLGGMRMTSGDFGDQIVTPVTFKGKEYDFAIRIDSGNHTRIEKAFGRNAGKWKGRQAKIEVKNFGKGKAAKPYIAIVS